MSPKVVEYSGRLQLAVVLLCCSYWVVTDLQSWHRGFVIPENDTGSYAGWRWDVHLQTWRGRWVNHWRDADREIVVRL